MSERTGRTHPLPRPGGGRLPARVQAILATLTVGLAAALALAVAPGAEPAYAGTGGPPTAGSSAPASRAQAGLIGFDERVWGSPPLYRARAVIWVYEDHKKELLVCDNSPGDRIGLAIQIDPSGPAAPLTYYDTDGGRVGCLDHDIWYSVRKWRWVSVYHNGQIHDDSHPWLQAPLPRPDF